LQWATRLTRRCHEEHDEGRARATQVGPYYEGLGKKSNYNRASTPDSKFVWVPKSSHHTPFWLAQQPGPHPCEHGSFPSSGLLRRASRLLAWQRASAARLPLLPRVEARSSTGSAAPLPHVASSDQHRVARSTEGNDTGLAGSSPSHCLAMVPGPFSSTWACASSSARPLPWRLRPPLSGVGPFSFAAAAACA
jgi:hypothetical protein